MLYFAHTPRTGRKPSNSAIEIGGKHYEPSDPSTVSISPFPYLVHYFSSLVFSFIGLVVAVLTKPVGAYLPLTQVGTTAAKPSKLLPFRGLGHGFALLKGRTIDPSTETSLFARGYSVMTLNNRTVYLKEEADSDDYKWVTDNIDHFDERFQLPNRYLSTGDFYGYRMLLSVTSSICLAMVMLGVYGEEEKHKPEYDSGTVITDGVNVGMKTLRKDISDPTKFPTWSNNTTLNMSSSWGERIKELITFSPHTTGDPIGAVIHKRSQSCDPFYSSSSLPIVRHGQVCPFRPDIALPGSQIIPEVLSKHFMKILGDTLMDQIENLGILRRAAAGMKLTRLGDEFAHLYKTIDLAVSCHSGMVPIFSGSTYDGSVLMGGPGASLVIYDKVLTFDIPAIVKNELGKISIHATAIEKIASFFPSVSQMAVKAVTNMVDLRQLCLSNSFTSDQMSTILAVARGLDFGMPFWSISPNNLLECFRLVSGSTKLTNKVPISRASLFSKDDLLVALSVFGEKEVPSWNIPSGALRKLTGKAPPQPPVQGAKLKNIAGGGVDDGAWVMEVRSTTLEKAVEEFRLLAAQGGYRTIPSSIAKRQHYRVFQSARMVVFWAEMQKAYSKENASFKAEDRDDSATIGKRSPGSLQGNSPPAKKSRPDI